MRPLTLPEMLLWAVLLTPTLILFYLVIKARLEAYKEAQATFILAKPGTPINDALRSIYKPTGPTCSVCGGCRTIAIKGDEIPCRFC